MGFIVNNRPLYLKNGENRGRGTENIKRQYVDMGNMGIWGRIKCHQEGRGWVYIYRHLVIQTLLRKIA